MSVLINGVMKGNSAIKCALLRWVPPLLMLSKMTASDGDMMSGIFKRYKQVFSVYLRQATCFYKLNYMKLELMLMDYNY